MDRDLRAAAQRPFSHREATDRVRDIALKAIEGASGASALARVSEVAMQQAKRGES